MVIVNLSLEKPKIGEKGLRMIQKRAYPRVSIAGNPSDGFWGKCISMSFLNYSAQCAVSSSEYFVLQREGRSELGLGDSGSLDRLLGRLFPVGNAVLTPRVEENKLALAAIKTFFDFCMLNNIEFERKPLKISYYSTIHYSLGFSGSTAVSVSILRALDEFYGTRLCSSDIESMALHAETHELRRNAGPQDPVAVSREKIVYMDFSKGAYRRESANSNLDSLERAVVHADYSSSDAYLSNRAIRDNGFIRYAVLPYVEAIEAKGSLPLFIITGESGSDSSKELSPNVQAFRNQNKRVLEGMERIANLAVEAKSAIIQWDMERLGEAIRECFELSIEYFDNDYLGKRNIELVREAIKCGAYAKFPGSGGAVFGLYPSDEVFQLMQKRFGNRYKVEKLIVN